MGGFNILRRTNETSSPETLQKLASVAHNSIEHYDSMLACAIQTIDIKFHNLTYTILYLGGISSMLLTHSLYFADKEVKEVQ